MKANRKFLNNDEEAVSPVIAVILMVAITVVLAATVYVWVSGFSGQNGAAAASLSVSQVSAMSATVAGAQGTGTPLKFTVTSISPGFQAGNLKILDLTQSSANNYTLYHANPASAAPVQSFSMLVSGATATTATTTIVNAGDVFALYFASGKIASGDQLQFIDTNSNNAIATITVR